MINIDYWLLARLGGIAVGTWVGAKLVSKILRKVFKRTELPERIESTIVRFVAWAIYLIGFFSILGVLGIDLSAFLVTIGAMSIAISFATKDVIQNLVSGIILYADRPFKVGDKISIRGMEGRVIKIGVRTCVLETDEGDVISLPNSLFLTNPVKKIKSK